MAVRLKGQGSEYQGKDKEHVGLDKADEQLKGHKEWENRKGEVARQQRDKQQQDLAGKRIAKESEA